MGAQVLMIASGKGGTGKSTTAVLLGGQLASLRRRVLLIELDSGLRSVDIISGVYGKTVYDIQDVLSGRCAGEKAVIESPLYRGLSVISAPYEGGAVETAPLRGLCDAMRGAFDYILLDTAAGMGAPFQAARACAGSCILVLTPDAIALRDGRIVSDAVYNGGLEDVRLIVNRVTRDSFGRGAVRDLDECIDTVCARLLGVVPECPAVQQAAAKGEAVPPGCAANEALGRIARRVLGQRVPLRME